MTDELMLHHRPRPRTPITCGADRGSVTSVIGDVQCRACLIVLSRRLARPDLAPTITPTGEPR